jgi:integral membrane protein (TIGR00529 family)
MGTLLVTGGAIMAAPLVDEIGDDLNLEKSKKAAINLVFRHGWYFIYPMMPGFILVSEIAKIDKFELISIQWPLTIVILAIGYFMWIRPSKVNGDLTYQNGKRSLSDLTNFVKYSSPIWVSLVIALGLEGMQFATLTDNMNKIISDVAFPIGLIVGILLTFFLNEKPEKMFTKFIQGINISIMFSGLGIMIFKEMVGQLSVLNDVVLSFLDSGVPIYILFITLPLVTGLLSASTTSAIGVTLPILLPALSVSANPVPLIMLAYTSSFLGYLVSPLHLCQILTLEYFKIKISDLYKEYVVAIPATFIASIALYFIVK